VAQATSPGYLLDSLLPGIHVLSRCCWTSLLAAVRAQPCAGQECVLARIAGVAAVVMTATVAIDMLGGELFLRRATAGHSATSATGWSQLLQPVADGYFRQRALALSPANTRRACKSPAGAHPADFLSTPSTPTSIVRADPKRAETATGKHGRPVPHGV